MGDPGRLCGIEGRPGTVTGHCPKFPHLNNACQCWRRLIGSVTVCPDSARAACALFLLARFGPAGKWSTRHGPVCGGVGDPGGRNVGIESRPGTGTGYCPKFSRSKMGTLSDAFRSDTVAGEIVSHRHLGSS
jgi:hypothetical protein